ncbi:MAG: helix-turn-helix domain-containing protein, partial [Candidatus Kapaibacterium sp.]
MTQVNYGNPSRTSDNTTAQLTAQSGGALLNAEQAAHFLGLSVSYLRKAVAGNRVPYIRIGTRVLFKRAALEAWIDSHSVATTSEVSQRAEGIAASALLR